MNNLPVSDVRSADRKVTAFSNRKLVFLCGARDFHAMDWYRSALKVFPNIDTVIVTDLIQGEGFKNLITEHDTVYKLVVLDRILFTIQSRYGDIWRNFVKAVLFPIQVTLLRRFAHRNPGALYQAHSMYYLWLAWAAGVDFVGTPQGGDILEKPWKSLIYRILSIYALKAAKAVTVDSRIMADNVHELAGVNAVVIQNGIDMRQINNAIHHSGNANLARSNITSFRAMTPLYNIDQVVRARNDSNKFGSFPLMLTYPFYESSYAVSVRSQLRSFDRDLGRVEKSKMYSNFLSSILAVSVPSSDSSPRSVYEAIFCGAAVALSYHPFVDALPKCMRSRVIVVDLNRSDWLDRAMEAALEIAGRPFVPSGAALDMFDQERSFERVLDLVAF